MLELLTLLGFQSAPAVLAERHDARDTRKRADEPPHQPGSLPLADEALLAQLYAFHRAEHC